MINNKEINIAFLMGRLSEKGGISRVTSIISNKLYPHYKDIHIISYHKKENLGYNWNSGLKYHELLPNTWSMKKGFFKAFFKLKSLLKKDNIQVLIICGHNMGPLAVMSSIFGKTKLIYWPHSSFNSDMSPYKAFNERFTSKFSDGVICLTKEDKINFLKETSAKRVYQVYNPIDPQLELLDSNYDLNSKKIISVGRLTRSKNFILLIELAKKVFELNKDYTWDIYGSGEDEDKIRAKINELNLEHKILLKGHTNSIYSVYSNYSILVMTSKYEGFPMSLLEGMANRLPLVSFDIPTGPKEIIRDNQNGFLIKPFDINDMATKIGLLMNNPEMRQSFSAQNEKYINEFNINNINEKWTSIINEIHNLA